MFDEWWNRHGFTAVSNLQTTPSFEEYNKLLGEAYEAGQKSGLAMGGNYTADDDTYPGEITFENGTKVSVSEITNNKKLTGYCLRVTRGVQA